MIIIDKQRERYSTFQHFYNLNNDISFSQWLATKST